MKKLFWYVKQLFPLWYFSRYENSGKKICTVFKMHLGKVIEQHSFPLISRIGKAD